MRNERTIGWFLVAVSVAGAPLSARAVMPTRLKRKLGPNGKGGSLEKSMIKRHWSRRNPQQAALLKLKAQEIATKYGVPVATVLALFALHGILDASVFDTGGQVAHADTGVSLDPTSRAMPVPGADEMLNGHSNSPFEGPSQGSENIQGHEFENIQGHGSERLLEQPAQNTTTSETSSNELKIQGDTASITLRPTQETTIPLPSVESNQTKVIPSAGDSSTITETVNKVWKDLVLKGQSFSQDAEKLVNHAASPVQGWEKPWNDYTSRLGYLPNDVRAGFTAIGQFTTGLAAGLYGPRIVKEWIKIGKGVNKFRKDVGTKINDVSSRFHRPKEHKIVIPQNTSVIGGGSFNETKKRDNVNADDVDLGDFDETDEK